MSDFQAFSKLIHQRFNELSKGELFITVADGNVVWETYLAAFPEGTNPIYIERTEHDCSCCKNFIRNIGNVVAVVDGKLQSVWGVEGAEYPYNVVAKALDGLVTSQPVTDLFRTSEPAYGAESTLQMLDNGSTKRWNHFFAKISARHMGGKSVGSLRGEYASSVQVFKRGLEELSPAALRTVVELIEPDDSTEPLYRGEEFLGSIQSFKKAQEQYFKLKTGAEKNAYVWANASHPSSRFRNTVIGTLVQDLSEGVELEQAVRSFETKVAPTNYKRTTALITPRMVEDAMKTIQSLGLEQDLERRFAKISDVSVNNVLWVDNTVKKSMKDGLTDLLMGETTSSPKKAKNVENVSIEEFMANILPTASSVEMLVQGRHMGNFVSLTAPVHKGTGKLFKWDNDFGWSYDGNITDSIKEKVKKAGGNVTNAKLRVSLAWFNYDDLDIHVTEPNGNTIYFANKCNKLDVDMNAGMGRTREPVENVSWTQLHDGMYRINVNQFNRRETCDVGCVVEIENDGQLVQLSHKKAVSGTVSIATVTVKDGKIDKVIPGPDVVGGGISQEKWGINTETFVKVDTVMYSPNYWDDNSVGNKHWFFILEGCKNPEPARGIYNEFLRADLDKHRKVFEVLGNKTKCEPTDEQLSGLGFSSTRKDVVTVKVKSGNIQKTFNINF